MVGGLVIERRLMSLLGPKIKRLRTLKRSVINRIKIPIMIDSHLALASLYDQRARYHKCSVYHILSDSIVQRYLKTTLEPPTLTENRPGSLPARHSPKHTSAVIMTSLLDNYSISTPKLIS